MLGFVECFSRFSTRGATTRASSLLEAPDAWVEDAYAWVNAVRAGDGDQPALVARAAAPSLARLRHPKSSKLSALRSGRDSETRKRQSKKATQS